MFDAFYLCPALAGDEHRRRQRPFEKDRRRADVRMVYGKRPRDPWKNRVAIVTHATALSAREIVANYERRWAIEVLFTELKGTFGLGKYQMQKRQGIAG